MKSKLTGIWWWLFWGSLFLISILVVDLLYTLWPYPHGARGSAVLEQNVRTEWALLLEIGNERFVRLAYAIHEALYQALFVSSGVDFLIRGAAEPATGSLDDLGRRAVLAGNEVWTTAAAGMQLFAARLAVLALCVPVMVLVAIGAGADGWITWYRRRSGGGRESGFLYHRAKRAVALSIGAMFVIYLVPPVPLDPRWIFTVGLVALASSSRMAVAYFKKYL